MAKKKVDIYEGYAAATALSDSEISHMLEWGGNYFEYHIVPHFGTDKKDISILEIGCGNGRFIKYLTDKGYTDVEGIDVAEDQIEFGRNEFNLDTISNQDTIPYVQSKKKLYDVIYMMDVVEHLELEYLVELGRVIKSKLKPGGKLIMQAPNGLSPLSPNRFSDVTHLRAYTSYSFTQLQKMFGFSEINNFELAPFPHGLKSKVRKILWSVCIKPTIKCYMLVANGDTMDSIYTANILSVSTNTDKMLK